MKKFITFIMLCFVVTIQSYAVTAYPHPIDFQQPNGVEVTTLTKGDERIHWHETMDGYTLLFNQAGYLTYAQLDEDGNLQPSEFIATNIEQRDDATNSFLSIIEKNLFYSDIQKQLMLKIWEIEDEYESRGEKGVTGDYKTLCAFVQFPNKSFIKTISQFEPMFNQLGYTGNGTGSVRDFFKQSSYDQFDLIITLCGIYTAPQNQSYYAGSSGTANCGALAQWAAQQVAAEPSINFIDYSSSGNSVDGFHFIFAGMGQEAGGGSGTIWSHKSSISNFGLQPVCQNGKCINIYSCSPELLYGTSITTIGVICHEMTHAFGAPDFYDTDYGTGGQYIGTGYWDIMAEGSWNENGNRPPYHNMYTKVQFGWVSPIVLSAETTVTNMPNSAQNTVAYRINTNTNNEYYLLENRQKVGFDVSVPGTGLLIYHVHSSVGNYCINCTHPQKMYPVCASRTSTQMPTAGPSNYGSINSGGCPFPGTSNQTSFTDVSAPPMKSWANVSTGKPITNITNTGGFVSFEFMKGGATQYSVTLSSNPSNGGTTSGGGMFNVGATTTIKATPNSGFFFVNWTQNGTQVSTNPTYTFTVEGNIDLVANFKSTNNNLGSLTLSSGTLTPDFSPTVTDYKVDVVGAVSTITITGVPEDATATVTGNVTDAPLKVGANYFTITVTAQSNATKKYYITVTRAAGITISASVEGNIGGTISPKGMVPVEEGKDITFTMSPNEGYFIEYVLVDGANVGTKATYTFSNVTTDHGIIVKFTDVVAIENVDVQRVRIYPNPTNGYVTIVSDDLINNMVIFNSSGLKVWEKGNLREKSHQIDMTDFAAGIYYLRINDTVQKLIKE